MNPRSSRYLSLLGTFLVLASCGPASPGPQAGGGIGGTGNTATVVSGKITGFGSVYVSGYEYDTATTSMTIDGTSGSQSDLKQGMVVLIDATLTHTYGSGEPPQRTADTLVYEDAIEGIVQAVAPDGSSLVVLGQTVTVTSTTNIDPAIPGKNILSLGPGRDPVEVSGFVTGDGTIIGTWIGSAAGVPDYEVKGFIKNHNALGKSFEIGSLTVDYGSAALPDMPGQTNNSWNGLLVDVRGSQVTSGGSGPYGVRMAASRVKPDGLGTEDSEGSHVEGFVTQVLAPGNFYLGNLPVQTSPGTEFEGGTIADIIVGSYIEVEGPLVSGIVRATKVEFEGETELQVNVAAINSNDNTLSVTGLAGLVVQFDNKTALHGQGNPRQLADLRTGDHLKIHGRTRAGNMVSAKEVERTDPKSTVQVQGLITSAADPFVELFGSSIDTSSIPESGFRGPYGTVGRNNFFTGLSSGKKVSLRGTYQGNSVAWTSASRGS